MRARSTEKRQTQQRDIGKEKNSLLGYFLCVFSVFFVSIMMEGG